ncbi:c-type cytochrome biogenesis protein CcmI [Pararhodospirillum oryzae]|uniref:C-type cytochrome biogenesis protein CcmI n=1 Tax=Pararhodospirillum oryzae TaxID=478448 RepID=A0A512H6H9_9PROT|nr:c-type cytochrome biogenesis protein CcmI [Pararhodospirillum oryzae]GEO81047.1 c-type cytochrome biogenesis protein CcmI [Pararhodospirillum oryzae]
MIVVFWIAAVATGLAVAALLTRPLWRARAQAPDRAEFDLAVYRDQLTDIDRDLAAGLLGPEEAEAARLEVQRRLLAVPAAPSSPETPASAAPAGSPSSGVPPSEVPPSEAPAPRRASLGDRRLSLGLIAVLPAVALALYTWLGAPGTPDLPYGERLAKAREAGQPDPATAAADQERMAELQAAIEATPTDPEPRMLLARLLLRNGNLEGAVAQTTEAARLAPESAPVLAEHAQVLVIAASGQVTVPAHEAFMKVLSLDPTEPRARFFLGLERLQAGDARGALAIWRHLKEDTPEDAAWAGMLSEQMEQVAANTGIDPTTLAPRHPLTFPAESWTPAPVAPAPAASAGAGTGMGPGMNKNLGEGERAAIQAMVESLKAKVAAAPDDFETWMMLARSQRVLEELDDAVTSYGKALELHPGDMEARRGLAFALIAQTQARGESEPPPALYMLMKAILNDNPEDQEALFFVGLEAANKGDGARARELWSKLLMTLPPDSSLATQIRQRMETLPQ